MLQKSLRESGSSPLLRAALALAVAGPLVLAGCSKKPEDTPDAGHEQLTAADDHAVAGAGFRPFDAERVSGDDVARFVGRHRHDGTVAERLVRQRALSD